MKKRREGRIKAKSEKKRRCGEEEYGKLRKSSKEKRKNVD